jgi:putative membrane protein
MDERGASGAGPSRGDRMRRGALAAYLVVWAALAVSPVDRETWLLENGLVFALAALLLAIRRRFRFSNLSMVLILAFLSLHAVGSHYTYSAAPPGVWARDAFGLARNHYDRFVHLAFGVLWAYPFRELALRRVHAHRIWSYVVPCLAVLSCSSGYEILESWAAQVVNPAIGVAFVGAQGDVWDGQKDMTLALGGAVLAMLGTARARRATGHEPWVRWLAAAPGPDTASASGRAAPSPSGRAAG